MKERDLDTYNFFVETIKLWGNNLKGKKLVSLIL